MGQDEIVFRVLERAAAAIPAPIGLYDVDGGRILPFGQADGVFLGYRGDEIASLDGAHLRRLVHAEDHFRLDGLARRTLALKDGEAAEEELRVRRADGQWQTVRLRLAVFARGSDESPAVILGTATPVPETQAGRRRPEGKERQTRTEAPDSAAVLQTLLEHAPESLILNEAEPELHVVAQSRRAHELFGRHLARVSELPAGAPDRPGGLYLADGRAVPALEDVPTYRAACFGEMVEGEEWLVRRPDGTCAVVEVQAVPVRQGNALVGAVSSWRDATVRKRLEEALREMAEQLALVARSTRVGWWSYEFATGSLNLSDAGRQLLDWPPDRECTPENLVEAVHPADRKRVTAMFDSGVEAECRFEAEVRVMRRGGEERWVGISAECHSDDFGKLLRLFAVMTDVTDRKRIEAALRESEERFRELKRSLSSMGVTDAHLAGRKAAK